MPQTKRKIDLLITDAQRKQAIDNLIAFFHEERSETIGIVAAGKILDTILESIGQNVYSKGVRDAKDLINTKLNELNIDLSLLE